jgi:hypothetical protein
VTGRCGSFFHGALGRELDYIVAIASRFQVSWCTEHEPVTGSNVAGRSGAV